MASGYHEPLYRLVFVGLVATALVVLAFAGLEGGSDHRARLASSTTVVPATLVVREPVPGAHVADPTVTVRGTAEPGATIAIGETTTTVGRDGTWSLTVDLPVGTNPLTVRATLEGRTESTITMTLTRDGAQVMTTTSTTERRRRTTTTAAPATTSTTAPGLTTTTTAPDLTTTSTTVEVPTTSTAPPASTTTSTTEPATTTTTTGG